VRTPHLSVGACVAQCQPEAAVGCAAEAGEAHQQACSCVQAPVPCVLQPQLKGGPVQGRLRQDDLGASSYLHTHIYTQDMSHVMSHVSIRLVVTHLLT
jgi:hypothetical protein